MQYFNIQVASQLSGVASATIRAWEKRYHAVHPERGDNKHRLYSEKDIEKLSVLSRLTELGQSIGKIAPLDIETLKEIYSTLLHKPYDDKAIVIPATEKINVQEVLNNFHLSIAAYKLDILSHEFEKTRENLDPRALCLDILVPLFHQIGQKVDSGEFSVAQEHAVSAITRFHIGLVISRHYQKNFQRSDLLLISTPDGEMHEIGILAAALLCVHYGIKFIFLGANLPAAALAEAANALNATSILIGVSRQDQTQTQSVSDYVTNLEGFLKKKTQIWVGGNLKPASKNELEKKKVPFFSSLQAFDTFLQKR